MDSLVTEQSTLLSAYFNLTKPRILLMVLIMCAAGYVLATHGIVDYGVLSLTLLGTGLSSAGAAVLNNYLERDIDRSMHRTRKRALPTGTIPAAHALSFGLVLTLLGVSILVSGVNLLTGFLSLLTVFLYVLVYTPLKRVTWLNTLVGAIPGALPPMGGWTAATGHVDLGAWVIFAILFIWQHPHFYAIAWMYREDYARGGFKMLPVVEPDGASTFRQIIWFSAALIPVSLVPTFVGISGKIYMGGMLISGLLMLWVGIHLSRTKTNLDAKRLLRASIVYLPVFFALILADIT